MRVLRQRLIRGSLPRRHPAATFAAVAAAAALGGGAMLAVIPQAGAQTLRVGAVMLASEEPVPPAAADAAPSASRT